MNWSLVRARLLSSLMLALLVAGCTLGYSTVEGPRNDPVASPTAVAPTTATQAPTLPPVTTTEPPLTATPMPTPYIWLPDDSFPPIVAPPTSAPPTTAPPTTAPGTIDPSPPSTVDPGPTSYGPEVRTGDSRPTRIVVRALRIDLAVVKGNSSYPYCGVAQYMLGMANPGQPGTTYLYGHARTGMFLPFLTKSKINNGASMIGMVVELYTADKKLHVYKINIVKRHAKDLSLAYDLNRGQHRLIMQTSEGPNGSYPKLQIAAKPIAVYQSTAAAALPDARPRTC